jgi:hypothetical protein
MRFILQQRDTGDIGVDNHLNVIKQGINDMVQVQLLSERQSGSAQGFSSLTGCSFSLV